MAGSDHNLCDGVLGKIFDFLYWKEPYQTPVDISANLSETGNVELRAGLPDACGFLPYASFQQGKNLLLNAKAS
jgi:hypothetical protein